MLEWTTFADPVSQADWAELSCLLRDRPNLSGPEIGQFLNREIGEEDAEKIVENIKGQIAWRRRQMQNGYPFDLSEGNLCRRAEWRNFLPYTFMLLLDTHGYYEKTKIRRWNEIAKLFERLVTQSMRLHLGNAINIGSPRIPTEAPTGFQKCIAHICRVLNERKGQPSRLHWRKDGGVDVISWRKLDERPGKVVFLAQCAAGENWKTKQSVPLKSWSEWIFFATQPIEVLAFPSVCSIQDEEEEEIWRSHCQGRLLMDRLRLATFDSTGLPTDLNTELDAWCSNQMQKLH